MVITFLRRLVFGCWADHGAMIRGRDDDGYYHRCDRCGYQVAILPGQHGRVKSTCVESPQALRAARRFREWQERKRA